MGQNYPSQPGQNPYPPPNNGSPGYPPQPGLAGMAGAALGGNMGGHGMGGHGMGGHGMGGPLGHSMGGGSKMSKKAKKAAKYGLPIAAVVGGGYMAGKAFGHRGGGSSSSSGSDSD